MLKANIEIEGNTTEEILAVMDLIKEELEGGLTSGYDTDGKDGNYNYELSGESEEE